MTLSYSISTAVPRQELGAQATVRAFLAHIEKGDIAAAAAMVEGSTPPGEWMGPLAGGELRYAVKAVRTYGDDKETVVVIDIDATLAENSKSMTDTFRLRKVDGIWKIQSNAFMDSIPSPAMVASVMISSPFMNQAKTAAKQTSCLSNAKQLVLGTIMYCADYDDVFPNANKWRSSIMPYVKNTEIFRCPDDKSGSPSSYRMNPKLSKVSVAALEEPANTVLVYEGDGNGFIPRHGGKGSVAFADGHAKMIAAAAYPRLRQKR